MFIDTEPASVEEIAKGRKIASLNDKYIKPFSVIVVILTLVGTFAFLKGHYWLLYLCFFPVLLIAFISFISSKDAKLYRICTPEEDAFIKVAIQSGNNKVNEYVNKVRAMDRPFVYIDYFEIKTLFR